MELRLSDASFDVPGVPPGLWSLLLDAAAPHRLVLVGGAVRDWLLHLQHLDPWRGVVDLDLVIEDPSLFGAPAGIVRLATVSPAWKMVEQLRAESNNLTVRSARPHGQYATVELEVEFDFLFPSERSADSPLRLVLDVASARREVYPVPGDNPEIHYGALVDDLARRDLTINAMALDLATGQLLDPHGGQVDLAAKTLRFLHPLSLRDDPTRLLRAARYAARLGFELATESKAQASSTLAAWPWLWRFGDPPDKAPAALGTRLRYEMVLLLESDTWQGGLQCLQAWGGLKLFDPALQVDHQWSRRLHRAQRFRLPLLVAFVALIEEPLTLAERLQLPHRQLLMLRQFAELRRRLTVWSAPEKGSPDAPWRWCELLESPGLSSEAIALALVCDLGPRRPLLRWWFRWRHLGPDCSAKDLIASGVPRGPELGEQLRRSRRRRLEAEQF